MAVAWQTLEEAALTLGISSRTLHRRISRGEVATRMEGGRREVQVIVPDPPSVYPSVACDTPSASVSAASDMAAEIPQNASAERVSASDTVGQMSDDVHGTVLALHEDRIRRTRSRRCANERARGGPRRWWW